MGPRRTTVALALLALGLLVASAGTAVASSRGWSSEAPTTPEGASTPEEPSKPEGPSTPEEPSKPEVPSTPEVPTTPEVPNVPAGTVPGKGDWSNHADGGHDDDHAQAHGEAQHHELRGRGHDWNGPSVGADIKGDTNGGGVTGTSVDLPSAPVQAPAATASGPAPDAVAPALIDLSALARFSPTSVVTGPAPAVAAAVDDGGVAPAIAAAVTDLAPPTDASALAGLPALDSIGALGSDVPDARALLTTRTGRPLAVFLALLAAIVVFLAIHRRVDGSDPRLSTTHTGPDVARFR